MHDPLRDRGTEVGELNLTNIARLAESAIHPCQMDVLIAMRVFIGCSRMVGRDASARGEEAGVIGRSARKPGIAGQKCLASDRCSASDGCHGDHRGRGSYVVERVLGKGGIGWVFHRTLGHQRPRKVG
jgi:hypothetical protein